MRRAGGLGVLLLVLAVGCDESPALEGGLVLGRVDTYRLCDVNAESIRLQAQWQACAEEEPDCMAPETTVVEGDRFSCPATGPTVDLGVELPSPGRYRVEVHTVQTSGPAAVECFVDPQTDGTEVQLPSPRLFDTSPVVLDEHIACP